MHGLIADPVRVDRLHLMARGQGLGLAKPPHGILGAGHFGRYLVYDLSTRAVLQASHGSPLCLGVDDLEAYLTGGVRTGW